MFKNILSKYTFAFAIIIIVGFLLLSFIMGSIVTAIAREKNTESVYNTTEDIKFLIESGCESHDGGFNEYVLDSSSTLYGYFDRIKDSNRGLIIFITNDNGEIAISNGDLYNGQISSEILNTIFTEGDYNVYGTIESVVEENCYIRALSIQYNGENVGAIFACAKEESISEISKVLIVTMIVTCVLVMVASIIASYLITERITTPIRAMSTAAKDFSEGKFETRVPVIGNDEVSQLALAFNNMANSLDNHEQNRRTFLANVSHDLRTPMFNISGFIEGILSGAIKHDDQEKYLLIIKQEVKRLSRLVERLLDISRIQAGDRKFNKEPFDICEMARQILISFEQKIENKKLNVNFDVDEDKMYVLADRDAIHQTLYNICDNAVKFSKDGGEYSLTINRKDNKTYVSVYNEGKGIPKDELSLVFDRFYKADKSRGLDKTGTGLGLFIAKTIMDAHGEKIWVESEVDKYCKFTFTIDQSTEQSYKSYSEVANKN